MNSKIFKLVLVLAVLALLSLPEIVLTQGRGRVINRRTRRVYTSLNDALAATRNGDLLLASGALDGAVDLSLAPGGVVIVGESRAAFAPTISVASCPASGAVIDAKSRNGAVQLIGLNIKVPDPCAGIMANAFLGTGDGWPLAVRNCRIFGATQSTPFSGILVLDETGGPYVFDNNTISNGAIFVGIGVDGDGATDIEATVKSNRILGNGGGGIGAGIQITDIVSSSSVLVEKNTVNGGGPTAGSGIGILLGFGNNSVGGEGVTLQRNTVINFSDVAVPGRGVVVDGSPDSKILANLLRDNVVGIRVDPGNSSVTTPVINNNNITCSTLSTCKAAGFIGLSFGFLGTYNLDARNNYWGASTGPDSVDTPSSPGPNTTCPEATGGNCTGQVGGGTGLPIEAVGFDCGVDLFQVRTCPVRALPNSNAGA